MLQEIFAKKDIKAKKTVGSSHLVCPEAEGQKYSAAIKWSLPVVSKDWLLACQRDNTWVSEQPFLVGDSTTFTEGRPLPRDPQDETMMTDQTKVEVEDQPDTTMETDDVRCQMEDEITFGGQEAPGDPNTPMASKTLKTGPETPGLSFLPSDPSVDFHKQLF